MECPRCDRPLDRYALGGREAIACGSCGFIGVPVEHRGERREVESWDDAISRFHEVESVRAGTVESTDDTTPQWVVADDDGGADGGTDSDQGVVENDNGIDSDPSVTVVRIETAGADAGPGTDDEPGTVDEHGAFDGPGSLEPEAESAETVACDVCGRQFDRPPQLYGHMAVHSRDEE